MGGCDGAMLDTYCDYVTPYHNDSFTMTCSDGLINLLGDILSTVPPGCCYHPKYINEIYSASFCACLHSLSSQGDSLAAVCCTTSHKICSKI